MNKGKVSVLMEIFDIIHEIKSEISDMKVDSRLIEDLGFDSVEFVELFLMLEDQYNIEISDFDYNVDTFKDVNAVVEYVVQKL